MAAGTQRVGRGLARHTAALVVVAHQSPCLRILHFYPGPVFLGLLLPVLGVHGCHPQGLRLSPAHTTVITDEGLIVHIAHSQKIKEGGAWL